jgi:phosphoglucomutase
MNGQQEIAKMMEEFRSNPPQSLAGSKVVSLLDYQQQVSRNLSDNSSAPIKLPKSNVLQFVLEDGSKVSARPSGTEPKIKFYFSVNTSLGNEPFEEAQKRAQEKIETIKKELLDKK